MHICESLGAMALGSDAANPIPTGGEGVLGPTQYYLLTQIWKPSADLFIIDHPYSHFICR